MNNHLRNQKNQSSKELHSDNLKRALAILDEAEEAFQAKSMAAERALKANKPLPISVSDYLFWIENEAALQKDHPGRQSYWRALQGVAMELRELGFTPSPVPKLDGPKP